MSWRRAVVVAALEMLLSVKFLVGEHEDWNELLTHLVIVFAVKVDC